MVFHIVTCSMSSAATFCPLPMVILCGISAGGSFTSVPVVREPRQGQRRSYKERPSEVLGKGLFIQCLAMVWDVSGGCERMAPGGVPVLGNQASALKSWHWAPGNVY